MGIDFRPGRAARFGRRHYREGAPHNNGIHFCPAPLPAREFSARSLCGMTQGARKRAVLRESQREEHWEVSAKYRLGERLRPCPGCAECFVCLACENGTCKREHHCMHICDGSGVLPAKRHRRCGWWLQTRTAKNATQRCGMPTDGGWLDCQHCGGSGWLLGRA